ncbi:ABC transporter substrate-binding protein [Kaistia dalseonensis]|uniref:Multiple sugar transport system substrate-binding protein n=1 Tax=Kaistia dalseonensis TaxID=410840 RepID=A0ABU0HAU4_9HYPH|nr:ABC transporter substrate-binding protein [Kaistia dalseonensis]MCX5496485.1 ABC transporter substrate-binding protein [Kaistia dalseonensis]MDQ0439107.1 multiple sugar transport system substrate-binding protein [Kaistia dalseonensis]
MTKPGIHLHDAQSITRRSLLAGAVAGAAFSALPMGRALAAERVRFVWWGSQERADRTNKAIAAYKAVNPALEIVGEFSGWNDYWTRLATQVAGRNAPDLIQMDYRYIFEYARRGALMPLDDYLGKGLDIADFGAANIDSGRVGGKLYGVNLGVNSSALLYDTVAWQKAGVEAPAPGMTWEQFGERCLALSKAKTRPGIYGMSDGSSVEPALELWLRQRGKSLYADDGKLGFDAADIEAWFSYWEELRKAGAIVPADIAALDQASIETNALTTGKAMATFAHSNQFVGFQKLNKSELGLSIYPSAGPDKPSGHYLKPSMQLSLASTAKSVEAVIGFVNFLVAKPEGVNILGLERGVPASEAMRKELSGSLNAVDKKVVELIAIITKVATPLPPPPPSGAGEITAVLTRVSQEIAFESITPKDGATKFVSEADAILARG